VPAQDAAEHVPPEAEELSRPLLVALLLLRELQQLLLRELQQA
jgi:hypothetical protein